MQSIKLKIWRLFLRALRAVTLTVDDWIQTQENLLRAPAYRGQYAPAELAAFQTEVDPVMSSRREKAHRAAKPRRPRLVYQHGEFVRQGGAA